MPVTLVLSWADNRATRATITAHQRACFLEHLAKSANVTASARKAGFIARPHTMPGFRLPTPNVDVALLWRELNQIVRFGC
jgi:hypothetical protein